MDVIDDQLPVQYDNTLHRSSAKLCNIEETKNRQGLK